MELHLQRARGDGNFLTHPAQPAAEGLEAPAVHTATKRPSPSELPLAALKSKRRKINAPAVTTPSSPAVVMPSSAAPAATTSSSAAGDTTRGKERASTASKEQGKPEWLLKPCPGLSIVKPGVPFVTYYHWQVHDPSTPGYQQVCWEITTSGTAFAVKAGSHPAACTRVAVERDGKPNQPCESCFKLRYNAKLRNVLERCDRSQYDDALTTSNHQCLSIRQLVSKVDTLAARNGQLLDQACKHGISSTIANEEFDPYKIMMKRLAQENVPGVAWAIAQGLRDGVGVTALLEQVLSSIRDSEKEKEKYNRLTQANATTTQLLGGGESIRGGINYCINWS